MCWNKKKGLLDLVIEHDLVPEKKLEDESKSLNYERLKTIKQNPTKVSLENAETGEIKTFPSINKAAKFTDRAPLTISYWDGRVWNNKYKIAV